MESQLNFQSRVGARAVLAGIICLMAFMISFMTLGGGFGLWTFDLTKLKDLGPVFWMWSFISWVLSSYLSGYVAAKVSRSSNGGDGALHGLVVWAAACVLGTFTLGLLSGTIFNGVLIPFSSAVMLWGAFLSQLMGLAAAAIGGASGARSELRIVETEKKRDASRSLEPALSH